MRELFLLPKQVVYEIIALLHLGIRLYDGIYVNLKHRGYCLAVGGWPLRQTQTIRIAGLYKVDVILVEDVADHVIVRLPVEYAVGWQCAHCILDVGRVNGTLISWSRSCTFLGIYHAASQSCHLALDGHRRPRMTIAVAVNWLSAGQLVHVAPLPGRIIQEDI